MTEARAATDASPINPQRVFQSLSPRLPGDVMLACDVGSATNWYARHLKIRHGMLGSVSGGLASMGNAVPYLLAAKFAHPERPAVALVGDGAMQMLGNNALITLAKYWREWKDPRCIILVLNNHDLSQVTWEQRVMEGDPKFDTSQDLPEFHYDQYAELLGFKGLRMEHEDDVDRIWDEAMAADRPVVINAYTDPDIAPLPPHIEFDQAKSYLASIVKGDSSGVHSAKLSAKQMGRSLFKRKH
ncbi:thiamine pyrophosphate-dependent enzyme [Halomonas sp. BC04]|uniref:thiamine pyrophosphate-dependent enzyme n=1 Tax=Halomonas sp. BC04 TaxID=1403540 RepID=UPI001E2B4671|nr:thiamine pyrophosphate-dependent enzyme [Halomonas sp. BC04]